MEKIGGVTVSPNHKSRNGVQNLQNKKNVRRYILLVIVNKSSTASTSKNQTIKPSSNQQHRQPKSNQKKIRNWFTFDAEMRGWVRGRELPTELRRDGRDEKHKWEAEMTPRWRGRDGEAREVNEFAEIDVLGEREIKTKFVFFFNYYN